MDQVERTADGGEEKENRMTREEIITKLKWIYLKVPDDEYKDAVREAISALEQISEWTTWSKTYESMVIDAIRDADVCVSWNGDISPEDAAHMAIICTKGSVIESIKQLPSVKPEYCLDEWCTDCSEYDSEKHCCPRYNRVIRTALAYAQAERNFLSGLSAKEQYDKIKWLFDYGKGFTDSRVAVIEWLEKHSAQPELPIKKKCTVCPHCDNCDVNDDGTIAQPERKKGKWESHPTNRKWDVCTECHRGTKRRDYGIDNGIEWVEEESYAFCPWCGADMRGDQDETNKP